MIDRFHSDPEIFVFLISTLAGGTGLNLTGNMESVAHTFRPCAKFHMVRRGEQSGHLRQALTSLSCRSNDRNAFY